MLDLSIFKDFKAKVCVRCYDEESSLMFLKEMMTQYPEKCRNWSGSENHYLSYNLQYIDYFPYLNDVGGTQLCWDSEDYAENNGYTIIDFESIPEMFVVADLGELSSVGLNIDLLFT